MRSAASSATRSREALEDADRVPALGSIVLHFDVYGRLAAVEVTESAASVLPTALLEPAQRRYFSQSVDKLLCTSGERALHATCDQAMPTRNDRSPGCGRRGAPLGAPDGP
jgi:hypothetical protein